MEVILNVDKQIELNKRSVRMIIIDKSSIDINPPINFYIMGGG